MTCPSRKNTRNTYFRRQDHHRQRQQQRQQQQLDEALARQLNAIHIAPSPDYLVRCLRREEARGEFAREQELRWRTILYEHLEGSNDQTTCWGFGLMLLLILGFIIILNEFVV